MNKKKEEAYKVFKSHIVSKTVSVYQNDLNKHQNPEYVQSQTDLSKDKFTRKSGCSNLSVTQ